MPRKENGDRYPEAKLVLYALSDLHNAKDHTKPMWPSQKTLGRLTGLSASTVRKCLKLLEEQEYITREHRRHASGPRKGQQSNDHTYLNLKHGADDMDTKRQQPQALQWANVERMLSAPSGGPTRPAVNPARGPFIPPNLAGAEVVASTMHRYVNGCLEWAFGIMPMCASKTARAIDLVRHDFDCADVELELRAVNMTFNDEKRLADMTRAPWAPLEVLMEDLALAYSYTHDRHDVPLRTEFDLVRSDVTDEMVAVLAPCVECSGVGVRESDEE